MNGIDDAFHKGDIKFKQLNLAKFSHNTQGYLKNYCTDTTCLYSMEWVFHAVSKFDNKNLKFWKILTFSWQIYCVVCNQLPHGEGYINDRRSAQTSVRWMKWQQNSITDQLILVTERHVIIRVISAKKLTTWYNGKFMFPYKQKIDYILVSLL